MSISPRALRAVGLLAGLVVIGSGLVGARCGPFLQGTVVLEGVPATVVPGQAIEFGVGRSRLMDGRCPATVVVSWYSRRGNTYVSDGYQNAWTDPVDRRGQNCRGTTLSASGPVDRVRVVVPAAYRGGELWVQIRSWPAKGDNLDYDYAEIFYPVPMANAQPVANLFARATPTSAAQGTVLDASTSFDPSGRALSYAWDLDGDGTYETPGTADGLHTLTSSELWTREQDTFGSPPEGASLAGIARMQRCQGVEPYFASLSVAPEVTGSVPAMAGLHRLWDMKVAWRDVNPARGVFDWTVLDQRVAQAEAYGAGVLLVLGLTPQWAARDPNAGDPRWGAGSASPPADINDWIAYVRAVKDRYGTRIFAYEVWNEANLQTFWTGTPAEMAELASTAYYVLNDGVPRIVLTPSVTTRLTGPMVRFTKAYMAEMAKRNFPFDAFAIHSYPPGNADADERVREIAYWQGIVTTVIPATSPVLDRPIWDTEVNYGLAGPSPIPGASYTDAQGAALLYRTYVDSKRLGIDATFWYMYTASPYSLIGAQFWAGTPETLAAWNRVRQTFPPEGGNPCRGSRVVSVRVTTATGLASTAGLTVNFDDIDRNGSIAQYGAPSAAGAPITFAVNAPISRDPAVTAYTLCVDTTGSGRHTAYRDVAPGSGWFFQDPGRSTPGRYKISATIWSVGTNVGCGITGTSGNGLVQVVSTSYQVGPAARGGAATTARVYQAKSGLRMKPGAVVQQGTIAATGVLSGMIARGTYTLAAPPRGSGVRRPPALGQFRNGPYVVRAGEVTLAAPASAEAGEAVYVGTFTVLIKGRNGSLACLVGDSTPEATVMTIVGGTGTAARLRMTSRDAPGVFSPGDSPTQAAPPPVTTSGLLTASTGAKQALPASCRSLVRYLR